MCGFGREDLDDKVRCSFRSLLGEKRRRRSEKKAKSGWKTLMSVRPHQRAHRRGSQPALFRDISLSHQAAFFNLRERWSMVLVGRLRAHSQRLAGTSFPSIILLRGFGTLSVSGGSGGGSGNCVQRESILLRQRQVRASAPLADCRRDTTRWKPVAAPI